MDCDADSWRGQRGAVVVECAMDLGIGGQLGVDAGATKEIQSHFGLGEQEVPQVEWKLFVEAAEDGDEVVLECPNGAFGAVSSVDARRYELVVNIFFHEAIF